MLLRAVRALAVIARLVDRRRQTSPRVSPRDASVRRALRRSRSPAGLRRLFDSLDPKDWAERFFHVDALARALPAATVQEWARQEPESADAQLLLGARRIEQGWEARGRGSEVSEAQWEECTRHLEAATDALRRASELSPQDPTPWALRLTVDTLTSSSDEVRFQHFFEAARRDPEHWAAHLNMVFALTRKWGSTHDEMWTFARRAAYGARPGSDIPMILVRAHLEYWLYLDLFEERPQQATEFLKDEKVQEEILYCYDRSLAHPDHVECQTTVFARILAASWFWLVCDRARLRRELLALGPAIQEADWAVFPGEGELAKARKWAGV